jgi:hypothetical protein
VCEVHVAGLVVRVGHGLPNFVLSPKKCWNITRKNKTRLDMLPDLDVTKFHIWNLPGYGMVSFCCHVLSCLKDVACLSHPHGMITNSMRTHWSNWNPHKREEQESLI